MRAVLLLAALVAVASARYRPTPGGYAWDSCVHEVPTGTHVVDGPTTVLYYPDGRSNVLPRCPMPFLRANDPRLAALRKAQPNAKKVGASGAAAGWQVWSTYQHVNNETFTAFLGNFSVPKAPASWPLDDDAILYAFTGLQSDNWVPISSEPPSQAPATFDIIQPVLQYGGGSSNGGGKYWGVASWYVTLNDGALYSNEIKLTPGQVIFGNMTQLSPTKWFIGGVVNGQTTSITVTKPRLISQPWAYCTLEVYNINSCAWFPPAGSAIDFTQLQLFDANGAVPATWTLNNNGKGTHCTAAITASASPGATVTISF